MRYIVQTDCLEVCRVMASILKELLEAMAERKKMTCRKLSDLLDRSPSVLHRYILTMERDGLVSRDPDSSGKKKVRLQDIRPTMAGLDFMDEEFM